jgi:hypothetical protein
MLAPERSSIAIWSGSQQQLVVIAPGAEHMRYQAGAGGLAGVDQHMALLRHDHRGHGREQRGVGGQPAISPGHSQPHQPVWRPSRGDPQGPGPFAVATAPRERRWPPANSARADRPRAPLAPRANSSALRIGRLSCSQPAAGLRALGVAAVAHHGLRLAHQTLQSHQPLRFIGAERQVLQEFAVDRGELQAEQRAERRGSGPWRRQVRAASGRPPYSAPTPCVPPEAPGTRRVVRGWQPALHQSARPPRASQWQGHRNRSCELPRYPE